MSVDTLNTVTPTRASLLDAEAFQRAVHALDALDPKDPAVKILTADDLLLICCSK